MFLIQVRSTFLLHNSPRPQEKSYILSSLNVKNIIHNNLKYQSKLIFQFLVREIMYKTTIQCNTK
ncbi:unnamed protein product [Musa acuminata var. zebrina]